MTAQEVAAGLVKMLVDVGLDAHVLCALPGCLTVYVGCAGMEEPVFMIKAEAPGMVEYLPLRLGRTKALRAKMVADTFERDIRQRCTDIADRCREHTAFETECLSVVQIGDGYSAAEVVEMFRRINVAGVRVTPEELAAALATISDGGAAERG